MKIVKLDFGEILKLKKYIKKYYILIILNILLATMSSLVSSAPIALIKRLFDKGIAGRNEKDILYAAGAMIMLAIIGAILMYWNTIFSTVISSSIALLFQCCFPHFEQEKRILISLFFIS